MKEDRTPTNKPDKPWNIPTDTQMEWIKHNCGDKPCADVCGKIGIWYCPLK